MIISTIIMVASFLLVFFEIVSVLTVFHSCRNVSCSVSSSQKISAREDGYLIREYWETEIDFELDGNYRSAVIETSTFCQKGQVLNCYYYPRRDLVFRKRDIRSVLRAHSITAFSVGVLFLLLNLFFRLTQLGGIIIAHTAEAIAVVLALAFASFGVGFIVYSVNAFRHLRGSRVTKVRAEIADIVRKAKRHNETVRYTYYPIYKYDLGGFEHTVQSKLGREEPPKKGKFETLLADKKKGGLVEYKDVGASLALGICFLAITALLIYAVAFM